MESDVIMLVLWQKNEDGSNELRFKMTVNAWDPIQRKIDEKGGKKKKKNSLQNSLGIMESIAVSKTSIKGMEHTSKEYAPVGPKGSRYPSNTRRRATILWYFQLNEREDLHYKPWQKDNWRMSNLIGSATKWNRYKIVNKTFSMANDEWKLDGIGKSGSVTLDESAMNGKFSGISY